MSKNKDKVLIVSFRLIQSEDGKFKITQREAMNRTKRMIAFDRGLDWKEVSVWKNLEDDLMYSKSEKKSLRGLIEKVFFREIDAEIDSKELEMVTTVRDLYTNIWNKCNQEDEIITKGKNRIVSRTPKITKKKTLEITIQMIADNKEGGHTNRVKPDDNLKDDLMYTKQDKKNLKGLIEGDLYFGRYNAIADINDLIKDTTVRVLSSIIYKKYIPEGNKK